ncbi:MAG: heavy metal translocating P-type ATPase, partial [Cyanobacteria bacterium REEB65]|nr:heavy metal translocating P-type ATPase [Cyanobacteria bacterium REEB65]
MTQSAASPGTRRHVHGAPRALRIVRWSVTGLECADCAAKLQRAIAALPGVVEAQLAFATALLQVRFQPECTSEGMISRAVANLGYGTKSERTHVDGIWSHYVLHGLDCADCVPHVEDHLLDLPGVLEARINFGAATLDLVCEPGAKPPNVARTVADFGYKATERSAKGSWNLWGLRRKAAGTAISGMAFGLGLVLQGMAPHAPLWSMTCFALAIGASGFFMVKAASLAFKTSKGLDINFLMAIAVLGAILLGRWEEAAEVVFLFAAGNALAGATMDRTRSALRGLLQLAPATATIREGTREYPVPLESVAVGATVVIRPGERIPVDGTVLEGRSSVDQAALT